MESDKCEQLIDGSLLEGGGQILRISLALSSLMKTPVKIINIRGKRNPSGLKNQHSAICSTFSVITNSQIKGSTVGSKELEFIPGDNSGYTETYECDCNSAGSIGLMIQQTMPCLLFANRKITLLLKGGTIVSHSPPSYYISDVLIPVLNKMNITSTLKLERHGIFPIGGGRVVFECLPIKEIVPIDITERGELRKIIIRLVSTANFNSVKSNELGKSIQKAVKKEITKYLKTVRGLDNDFDIEDYVGIEYDYVELSFAKTKYYTLFGQIVLYFDNTIVSAENLFSEKKETQVVKNFEQVILNNFDEILHSPVCFDEYTVDHLIIFMALGNGVSRINCGKISLHTETAIEIVKKFIPEVEIKITNLDGPNILEIKGCGLINNSI
jgi:RNA 3'-terminal phosphate cyclase (ATP)